MLPEKIQNMRKGGHILSLIMNSCSELVTEGKTGLQIEEHFDKKLNEYKMLSAFKGYEGYPYHLCIGVNDMVVHGFPSDIPFKEGDIVTLDMGLIYNNLYLDMARAFVVGKDIYNHLPFIQATKEAFDAGVKQAKLKNRVGDISNAIQNRMERDGYSVVREMVGHGVGENLHEKPDIPGYGVKGKGPILKNFQTIAIEVIAIKGKNPAIYSLEDDWQTRTTTGSVCAIYENSVYVSSGSGISLTV